jgi:glycosyltransferase involved in cell wall biosynthesis
MAMPDAAPPLAEAAPGLSLSVVIPVCNGADSIGELVAALEALTIDGGHEIVLVNDASPDDSLAICRGLVERALVPIALVDLSRNYGELSTLTGFALSLVGAIGSLIALTEALFFDPPAGWASLMAAVLLLSGVQLVILGIVGEYIGRLYLTANKKPQSIVKSVIRTAPAGAPALPEASRPRQPARLRERA